MKISCVIGWLLSIDSIWRKVSCHWKYRVRRSKKGNEYRYKLLRDTLRIIETDTIYIPYGVKVTDDGKDKSFLPRFSELAKAAFLVVAAALASWVALRNKAWWCSSGGLRVPLFVSDESVKSVINYSISVDSVLSVDYLFSTEDTDKHGFLFCVFCVFCGLSFSHGWSRMDVRKRTRRILFIIGT